MTILPDHREMEAQLQRCGRLLERQRRAREDAEAIAEEGLRSLYLRQQRSELLQRVATIANLTSSAREAFARVLDEVCDHIGCEVGDVFVRSERGGTMTFSGIYQVADPRLLSFIADSRDCELTSGQGLPGRVLASRAPCWIANLADDDNFVRSLSAERNGLVSALAFPVMVGKEVNAVLEFYLSSPQSHDPELLEIMAQIGIQLGRVVEREELTRKLTHDAHHDALTGLPNKVMFRRAVEQALADSGNSDGAVAVMFMDLDGFKLVNDSAGHHSGDQLLIDVAHALERTLFEFTDCEGAQSFRLEFVLARFGGDEFTVLLRGVHARSAAKDVAQALLSVLEKNRLLVNDATYAVSSAFGIAFGKPGAISCDELMRNADLAMYDAKRRGRGQISIFGAALHQAAQERFSMQSALSLAREKQQFVLHYQPIVALTGNRELVGFEALVRWRRDGDTLLPPSYFIDLAEELDLIGSIGEFVLQEACQEASTWPSARPVYVSVNVSPKQFKQDRFLSQVDAAMAAAGLPAERLRLEVTESIAITDPERARETLHRLRERGIRVSLDDFGTGYSSLSHLHRFPFEALKIDRSFISGLGRSPRNQGIVRAVLDLASALELDVIAEGVELEEEAELLRLLGCAHAQGYRFGRPMPADMAESLLEQQPGSLDEKDRKRHA